MEALKWASHQLQLYQKLKQISPDQFRRLKAMEQFDGQPFDLGLAILDLEDSRDDTN